MDRNGKGDYWVGSSNMMSIMVETGLGNRTNMTLVRYIPMLFTKIRRQHAQSMKSLFSMFRSQHHLGLEHCERKNVV